MTQSKELYYNIQNKKRHIISFYNKIKKSKTSEVVECETGKSGKLKAGQKMPKKRERENVKQDFLVSHYDNIGSLANVISNQMTMMSDGFDFSLTNVIADNGNVALAIQGDKYFSMKHTFSFDGPLTFMLSGGQRDYSVECLVQSGSNYTLMSNFVPSSKTLDGQLEYNYRNISFLFSFAVTNSEDPRLNLMLPSYSGRLMWSNPTHNLTIGKNQTQSWYFSTLHRLTSKFLIGSKFLLSPETQESNFCIGGSYKIIEKTGEFEIIECRMSNMTLSTFYTKAVNKHSTLCTRLDLNLQQKNASSSIMYKYVFGSEVSGVQILGEITSKMICRTIFLMPFMQRFIFRINGEINHFDYNPQTGQVPHKFGFQIQMQI